MSPASAPAPPPADGLPGTAADGLPGTADQGLVAPGLALASGLPESRWPGGRALVAALALLLLAAVFFHAGHARVGLVDSWAWWRYGDWIDAHGRIPRHEPFALSAPPGLRLVDAGWLGQFAGHRLLAAFGLEGLACVHALLETLKAGLLLLALRRAGASWSVALAGTALGLALAAPFSGTIQARTPAEVLFAALLLVLARRTPGPAGLVAIPLLVGLWANLHPSFPAALALLAVLTVGRLLEQSRARHGLSRALADPGLRRLALATALACAAVLVNPAGRDLVTAVLRARDLPVLGAVQWPRLIPAETAEYRCLVLSFLLVFAVLRLSPRSFAATDVLLCGFGLTAAFDRRAAAWWLMLWPWLLAPHAQALLARLRQAWAAAAPAARAGAAPPRPARAGRTLALAATAAAAAVAAALLLASPAAAWLRGAPGAWSLQQRADPSAPVALAAALRAAGGPPGSQAPAPPRRVFSTPYHWGDYLLADLPERDRVFFHGSPRTFGPATVWEAAALATRPDTPDGRAVLDRYRLNAVVASERTAPQLCDFLRRGAARGEWRLLADAASPGEDGRPDVANGLPATATASAYGVAAVRLTDPFVETLAGADAAAACVGGLGLAPAPGPWGVLTHLPWIWPPGRGFPTRAPDRIDIQPARQP